MIYKRYCRLLSLCLTIFFPQCTALAHSLERLHNELQAPQPTVSSGLRSPEISFSETKVLAILGEEVAEPVLSNPHSLPVSYASSNPEVASVDNQGNITLHQSGYDTITVTTQATDIYEAGKAQYLLVVNSKRYADWRKTTSIESGKQYLIVAEDGDMAFVATNVADKCLRTLSFNIIDETINANPEGYAFTFTSTGEDGEYYIQQPDGNYIHKSWNSRYLSANETKSPWKVSFDGDKVIINKSNNGQINKPADLSGMICNNDSTGIVPSLYEVVHDTDITLTDAGYATTYYSDRAFVMPEGLTASTYQMNDGQLTATHTYLTGDTLPQGTAVVLKGMAGTYRFKNVPSNEEAPADNQLYGYDTEQTTYVEGANQYYKLSLDDNGQNIGFYWQNDNGAAFTTGAHKAFLALYVKSPEKGFALKGQGTGVKGVKTTEKDTPLFNLQGMRMSGQHLPAGIYIRNGKKFIVTK